MNIVCYINKMSSGGAERVMSVVANGLSQKGHKVTLVTDFKEENEYYIRPEVIRISFDGEYKEVNSVKKMFRNINRIISLHKICINADADVIISFIRQANYRAILATRGIKTKNLISIRIDPHIGYRSIKDKILSRILYPLVDGCVFQTRNAKEYFSNRIQRKSKIILNPISEKFYNTEGAPMTRHTIVSCGRLTEQKNFSLLIDAFAKVCNTVKGYELEIYGEGPLNEALQAKIADMNMTNIKLMGRTNDVASSIVNSSLFVMSSDFEGLPNALMEAMALGLPVISTDFGGGGATELIDDNVNGLIVPTNNVEKLAEAIEKCLSNPQLSAEYGKNAKFKANRFCEKVVIDEWEAYLKEIVEN